MEFWTTLFDVGALLGVAFVFGALCEKLRQSSLLGYLLAGMLLGPNALHVVSTSNEVDGLAEIGVSLLLFSLGLEFSWRRLRALGTTALGGGMLQVGLALLAICLIGMAAGLPFNTAVVVGAAFALSSTASVLRVLVTRSEMDSIHGRYALGILLFQDLAVIPLVLLTSFLAAPAADLSESLWSLGRTGLMLLIMVVSFYIVFNHVVPRVLLATSSLRNRELPVLLAVVGALGSIYVAHELGLSPAVGAFIAGMLLGESPFATQVRADLAILRTLLVTVFFSSIGMLADPRWILDNIMLVVAAASGVLLIKTIVCFVALRVVRHGAQASLAAALCLAQVGEFAFVIAATARGKLINDGLFMLIVSTMMLTLCVTPFLISRATDFAAGLLRLFTRIGLAKAPPAAPDEQKSHLAEHAIVIGYGPAGQRCAAVLREHSIPVAVIDLNPSLITLATEDGFDAHVGDGTHPDVLEHLNVSSATAVVIALPDTAHVEMAIRAARCQTSETPVIARARYNRHADILESAGTTTVVDEEEEVGSLLGTKTVHLIRESTVSDKN